MAGVDGRLRYDRDPTEVDHLKARLASACVALGGWNDEQVCGEDTSVRLICSNGTELQAGTDRCRREQDEGKRVGQLAAAVAAGLDLAAWIGEPTARQACEPGARDLAPREIRLTLGESLAAARSFSWPR